MEISRKTRSTQNHVGLPKDYFFDFAKEIERESSISGLSIGGIEVDVDECPMRGK